MANIEFGDVAACAGHGARARMACASANTTDACLPGDQRRSRGHLQGVGTERVGAAQARAQIVRIGDAVENEQQCGLPKAFQHVVERDMHDRGIDQRDDALVLDGSRQRLEPVVIGEMHRAADRFCARNELARARIVPRGRQVDSPQRIRPLSQPRGHCVEAVDGTGGRQGG